MAEDIRKRILKACYGFLLPLIRTLLRAGVTYREFDEFVRLAFVRIASDEYGLRGRPTNNSRISAMTGIARKEVSRIRSIYSILEEFPRTELSPLGDVLHRWHTDPRFLGLDGYPCRLPLAGASPSFEELVRSCSGDLPAGAIRVELLRIGAVRQDSDGFLHALRREAVPEAFDDRLLTSLSFNLTCLAATIAHNSNPNRKGDVRIERFVQSEMLNEGERQALRAATRKRIERFTVEIDDMFSATDSETSDRLGRVGVGVYYFEDD